MLPAETETNPAGWQKVAGGRSGKGGVGQTSGPLTLGIEARSHAGQRRIGRQRQSGGPVPPHPGPPRGRGRTIGRVATNRGLQTARATADRAPSPWGEGWGEGERGRRTVAAAQYVFGPRETEPQFQLAVARGSLPPQRDE